MDLIAWESAWGAWGRGAGVEQLIGLKISQPGIPRGLRVTHSKFGVA